MSFNFQPGYSTGLQWQATGQGQVATLLAIANKSFDWTCLLINVSGSGMNQPGRTGRLAGPQDSAVEVTLHYDADNPPYLAPPLIRPGVSGILLYHHTGISRNYPIQIPTIIEKLHFEDGYETEAKWGVSLKENAYAGLFVLPAA